MTTTIDARENLPFSIKPIPRAKLDEAVDIWVLSFGDLRRAFWRDYAEHELDSVLGAYIGDELGAVVGMHDFEVRFFDKWVPCLGIAGVASSPTRRGKGLVNALLTECLKSAHRRKIPLSMLGAARPSFYESMGWAVSDWHYTIELNLDHFVGLAGLGTADAYTNPLADPWSELEAWKYFLALKQRWSEKFALLIELATKPTIDEWCLFPLPTKMLFLYRVVRPISLLAQHGPRLALRALRQ